MSKFITIGGAWLEEPIPEGCPEYERRMRLAVKKGTLRLGSIDEYDDCAFHGDPRRCDCDPLVAVRREVTGDDSPGDAGWKFYIDKYGLPYIPKGRR